MPSQMNFREPSVLAHPLFLIALLIFALPLALIAQPPARGSGPMGPGGGAVGENLVQMLESPATRALSLADSLGLNEEQRASLAALERVWTETHGERTESLRTRIEAMSRAGGQPREREAMRGRMQEGGQAPLQGLMQEMAPLREGREAMLRDMAQILTADQIQALQSRLAPQRPGLARQRGQNTPSGSLARGWINRTDERLHRLEVQGQRMQRQLRQRRGTSAVAGDRDRE